MAYSAPSTRSTNDLINATIWNADVVANAIALHAGAMAVTSQAVGDLLYASSTTQFARIAAVATGQVLTSAGTGTVPAWSSNVDLGGTLDVTGATTLDSTLTAAGITKITNSSSGVTPGDTNTRLIVEHSDTTVLAIYSGTGAQGYIDFGDSGDSDIGRLMYNHVNNSMVFTTNATPALTISSSQGVDIAGTLDVTGATTLDSTLTVVNDVAVDTDTLFVDVSADNVGIGVTDPDVALDVSGGDNVLDIFRITQRASGAAAYGLQVGLAATGDPVFQRLVNDVATESFRIVRATGTPVFNEGSNDQDFRIESDDNANMFFVDGGEDRVGIGTATPDQIVDISSSSSIYPIVQTSAGNGNAVWRFKNDAETWEVGLRGDNSDKFTVGDITEGLPFFTLAIGTGNADFTGVVEGTGGFTSGTGSAVKLSQYNQTLDATDITNGYVTVTTTIARESVQNAVASMFDVSTNVFHSDLEDGYILDVYGATNWVRSSLGGTAAAGDIYKVLIWHY